VQGQKEGGQGLRQKAKVQEQFQGGQVLMLAESQMQHQPPELEQGLNVILVGGQNELKVQGPHGGKQEEVAAGQGQHAAAAGEGGLQGRGYCAEGDVKLLELGEKQ